MIYLKLYLTFFQIGLFSIGGGYAALPLIQEQVINNHGWLSLSEFTDLLTISTMTPGPIAINAATFVGTKMGGLLGAILATLGCVSPSFVIVLILAYFYYKYKNLYIIKRILKTLRPIVVALIASAGASIIVSAFWSKDQIISLVTVNKMSVLLFGCYFTLLRRFKLDQIKLIILSGIVGMILYGGIFTI